MENSNPRSALSEKKVLTIVGVVIFVIVAIIAYFEWSGRHRY
ncbi:MAG: hypothetical protein V4539_17515 [Bacteroidota bacterium]